MSESNKTPESDIKTTAQPLPPGSVIGILGGGQLGRMAALAAANLGYRSHIFCPGDGEPASQVTDLVTVASYDDEKALTAFARQVDVVTFEFENVPSRCGEILSQHVAVRPDPKVLHICQNRLREKDFLASIDVPTTRYAEVGDPEALARAVRDIGAPSVLKSAEFGYDGKGQVMIKPDSDLDAAWATMAGHAPNVKGILEGFVDFNMEISVVIARGLDGSMANYVPVENQHKNHILDLTIAPARISSRAADRAEGIARHIAEALDLVGLIGVEMFVTPDEDVLVNELAPRPHNSGHWTMDACTTSQFEQFIRAVAGLPLGTAERHSDAVMKNLIGDEAHDWQDILSDAGAKLHLYGKAEARPGRKMGHVNRMTPRKDR
ncbi:5-(carboxyamino)imidazole ribonucleotide synthase [Rhodovibrionaceae bacterium A322]